ncbi:MAG TPA: response regulator [Bryobacteraceae bacterium]|nr:response regulator [Bryobacteraceae bacterium]
MPRESIPPPFNLLLAEDNLPDALLVREAIRMENLPLEVYIAPDGERAIDVIVKAENDPDATCPHVLLLDINLPRIDGFEVLRRIRASDKFKNLPVLMVTSSDSPADRNEAAKLGAGYFRKPVTYDEFVKIGTFLRRLLEENGLL